MAEVQTVEAPNGLHTGNSDGYIIYIANDIHFAKTDA